MTGALPLRGAPYVAEQRLLDLLDDRDRFAPLALPDVAAEDDAGAAGGHHVAGVLQDRLVVGPGFAREDAQGPPGRFDALADRLGLVDLHLVVRRRGFLVLGGVDLR